MKSSPRQDPPLSAPAPASSPPPAAAPAWESVRRLGAVALGYAFALKLALFFPDAEGLLAAVWPPGGVALAALLLCPRRHHGAILATVFVTGNVVNLLSGRPPLASVGFMVANVLETWACAWLFTRWCGKRVTFARIIDVLALAIGASVVNALTAVVGAWVAVFGSHAPFREFYFTWWISDGMGILFVTPLVVVCARPWTEGGDVKSWRWVEAVALGALGSVLAWFGIHGTVSGLPVIPRPYWVFIPLVWAALRFGPRGTAGLLAAIAAITIGVTVAGRGAFPLGGANPVEHLRMAQLFLGVACLTGLTLAAVVSERKDAEQRLGELNRDFVAFLENTGDFIYFKDADSRFRFCSQTLAKITGHASWRDMIGKHDREVFPPDTARIYQEEELPIIRDGQPLLNQTDPYYDAAGKAGWVSTNKWPLFDADHRLVGLFGISRDITARKAAEEQVRRLADELSLIMGTISVGVSFLRDRRVESANLAHDQLFGYERGGTVGLATVALYARAEDHARVGQEGYGALRRGEVYHTEVELRRRDGSVFLGSLTGRAVNPQDRGAGSIWQVENITERRRAEVVLRQSEERYRSVVAAMAEGVVLQHADGRIIDSNLQAEHILGLSRDQLLGRTSRDSRWRAVKEDGRPFPGEEHPAMITLHTGLGCSNVVMGVCLPEGGLRWININTEPMQRPGEAMPYAVVATFSDISDRVLQQQEMRELLAQKEQDARIKGDLLREVNHRVTNNLTAVLGLMVYERENVAGDERSPVVPALDRLQQRIRGLLLVHRMLSQSAWAPVELAQLAEQIIHAALSAAPWRSQAVVQVTPSRRRVSPRQAGSLALIFNELTTNTVKHSGAAVHPVMLRVDIVAADDWTTICYRDNGPGFSTAVLEGQRTNIGLKLIQDMVATTLRGEMTLANDGGAVTTIRVRAEEETRT